MGNLDIPLDKADICSQLCGLVYDYTTDPVQVSKVKSETLKLFNINENCFQCFYDKPTDVQAFVIEANDVIYLVFRGTESEQDAITDAIFNMIPYLGGDCHYGFLTSSQKTFSVIGQAVKDKIKNNPKAKVVVSGHSLGGALAMLYCALFKAENINFPIESLITFGQPRCGNIDFVKAFNQFSIPYVRFVNEQDMVPDVPPALKKNTWAHGGREFEFIGNTMKETLAPDENSVWAHIINFVIMVINLWNKDRNNSKQFIADILSGVEHSMSFYRKNLLRYLESQSKA